MTSASEPIPSINNSQTLSPHEIINQAIERHYLSLRTGVQVMVAKSGLVDGEAKIIETGDEVLHDTIETALRSADKFDSSRSAYSWLMGIAVNKLREMRRDIQYETKRVQVFEDKEAEDNNSSTGGGSDNAEDSTAEERIDSVLFRSTNRSSLENQEQPLNEILALVKESDRRILTLAVVDGLSGTDLAAVLGIREGTAYMRLSRAKDHLRQKYLAIQGRKDKR